MQLDSGLLTQRVIGVYHYEGENLNYIITSGDRSLTEPEMVETQPEETQPDTEATQGQETQAQDNTMLYLAIAGIAAVILLAAVILVVVKKKAGKAQKN